MSTVTVPLDWEPTADTLYQLALATGEKPTQVDRNDDGTWTVTVRGIGAENLSDLLDGFTPDPDVVAPDPPRPPAPTLVPGPDGRTYALTVEQVDGVATPIYTAVE